MPNLNTACLAALAAALMMSRAILAAEASPEAAALARIRDAGMSDDWAHRRLADLCDKIGPRLSGSRQAEADSGAGRPIGVAAHVAPEAMSRFKPLMAALAPLVDTRTYFDYHHSAADTLDKVDPDNIRRQVAVLAMMAYFLAEMPDALPRLPVASPNP